MSKGCRFKEILGDANVKHGVPALWKLEGGWQEGRVNEAFNRVEGTLWEAETKTDYQVKMQMYRTKKLGFLTSG